MTDYGAATIWGNVTANVARGARSGGGICVVSSTALLYLEASSVVNLNVVEGSGVRRVGQGKRRNQQQAGGHKAGE